jgi:hypothetical protein
MPLIALAFIAVLCIFGGILVFNRLLAICTILAVVLAAIGLYQQFVTAPECDSDEVTFAVSKELSPKFLNGTLVTRNIHTVKSGFLSSHSVCEMDVAPVSLWDMKTAKKWTRVAYSTSRSKLDGEVNVEVHIVRTLVDISMGHHS